MMDEELLAEIIESLEDFAYFLLEEECTAYSEDILDLVRRIKEAYND